jgi:predicted Zn-dependent protease
MMKGRLEPEDERRVEAAKGWCALHDFAEAAKELAQVSPTAVEHPRVLEARWQVSANLDRWGEAHAISTALTRLAPHAPEGWIYLASSLAELDRKQEAFEVLRGAASDFLDDEIIHYDLACLCCALGKVAEGERWVARAIEIGGEQVRRKALDDEDLEPLWRRIVGGSK